jgi:hypothetical protein
VLLPLSSPGTLVRQSLLRSIRCHPVLCGSPVDKGWRDESTDKLLLGESSSDFQFDGEADLFVHAAITLI